MLYPACVPHLVLHLIVGVPISREHELGRVHDRIIPQGHFRRLCPCHPQKTFTAWKKAVVAFMGTEHDDSADDRIDGTKALPLESIMQAIGKKDELWSQPNTEDPLEDPLVALAINLMLEEECLGTGKIGTLGASGCQTPGHVCRAAWSSCPGALPHPPRISGRLRGPPVPRRGPRPATRRVEPRPQVPQGQALAGRDGAAHMRPHLRQVPQRKLVAGATSIEEAVTILDDKLDQIIAGGEQLPQGTELPAPPSSSTPTPGMAWSTATSQTLNFQSTAADKFAGFGRAWFLPMTAGGLSVAEGIEAQKVKPAKKLGAWIADAELALREHAHEEVSDEALSLRPPNLDDDESQDETLHQVQA